MSSGVPDSIGYLDGSYVIGYLSSDTLAFDSDGSYTVTGFNFLLGLKQKGFSTDDGLIGLTRFNQGDDYNIIVDQLYDEGQLTSNVFSFYLADAAEQSTFQIGGYDTTYVGSGSSISYIPLSDSEMFWDVNVQAFRVGLSDSDSKGRPMAWVMDKTSTACLDTGTSYMYMPNRVFPKVIKALLRDLSSFRVNYGGSYYYYGPCDTTQYESIYMLMGDTWFEIPPSVFVEPSPGYSYCLL